MALVELRNVIKDYDNNGERVRALGGFYIAVEACEFAARFGRSGCGNSSLLNRAGAMDLPTGGGVLIDGEGTSAASDSALTQIRRDKIGFVFQSFQLLHTL